MILAYSLPRGQVYSYNGFGQNDNRPAIPGFIANREMLSYWLHHNRFVLVAQSLFLYLHVSSNLLVHDNSVDACIRWIAFMTTFETEINVTLQYVHNRADMTDLWAEFPSFFTLVKLALRYDILITVNGVGAQNQAFGSATYRGIDIRFNTNYQRGQTLLLRLFALGNQARSMGWSTARLELELNNFLNVERWSTTNPKVWMAVKRIKLPLNITAYLGPYNLLYKTVMDAVMEIQAMNMGNYPTNASLPLEWRVTLGVALGKWKEALQKQLCDISTHLCYSTPYWYGHISPLKASLLGQDHVFGLYGDETLAKYARAHRGPRSHRLSLNDDVVHSFDDIFALAECASGELHRTNVHLYELSWMTD